MPDENKRDDPTTNPQAQPPLQSPVTPATPLQGALPDSGEGNANEEKNEAKELAREFRIAEKWVIGTNIVLAVIGIVALCIYYGQLRVMRGQLGEIIRQYPEIKKSADAAKSAADTADATLKSSQKSFIIDQRPYIVVDENSPFFLEHSPAAGQQILANVYLKNIGRTPAVQVVTGMSFFSFHGKVVAKLNAKERNKATEEYIAFIESKFAELRKTDDIIRKRIKELELRNIAPGQDVAPTKTYFLTSPNSVIVSKDDFPLLTTGEVTLYAIGLASYSDAYQVTYKTEFCYSWFGLESKIWHICDSHNRYQ